jgi:UDP-N-acetylglucosamine 2-epimerase
VGDVTFDVFLRMRSIAQERSTIIQSLRLSPGEYLLATIHHVRNTNDRDRMEAILAAMAGMQTHVVFPIHPRTRKIIREYDLEPRLNEASNISVIEPVGYLDMLELERNARVILTDSGGVTREAYFAQVPCVVVDDTIEWLDLVDAGWCHLVDAQTELIVRAVDRSIKPSLGNALLGDGDASRYILERLTNWRAGR